MFRTRRDGDGKHQGFDANPIAIPVLNKERNSVFSRSFETRQREVEVIVRPRFSQSNIQQLLFGRTGDVYLVYDLQVAFGWLDGSAVAVDDRHRDVFGAGEAEVLFVRLVGVFVVVLPG